MTVDTRKQAQVKKQVGQFTLFEHGSLEAPTLYWDEQGRNRLAKILSGQDTVFNMGASLSPDLETAILVSLQTDFAAWKGSKQLEMMRGAK